MVTCPHCEHPVDETAVTNCPLCQTPILPASASTPSGAATGYGQPMAPSAPSLSGYGAPMASAPVQGAPTPVSLRGASAAGVTSSTPGLDTLAPGTMRSLTGEIIQTPVSTGQPAVGPGSYTGPPAAPRANAAAPRRYEAAPAAAGGKGGFGAIALVLVLVLAAGGGWFWWTHRPGATPTDTVHRLLTAQANEDFKTIYSFIDLPTEMKTKYPDAQAFDDGMKSQQKTLDSSALGGLVSGIKDKLKAVIKTAKVGDAKIDGSTATVPVTLSGSTLGINKDMTVPLTLKNVDGIWKLSSSGGQLGAMGMGL